MIPWLRRPALAGAVAAVCILAAACSSEHHANTSIRPTTTATTAAPGSTPAPTASGPSIVGTGVQTVRTADGTVAYRSLGTGTPLILLMGYGGSIDSWEPSFIDTLAAHYRVITPNNAGVGRTTTLSSPLTITAMAQQTSAFITALGLGPSNVLGWSMGGMIAQALTVLHPSQVHRLVLCATLPGDGDVTMPSAAALAKLADTSDPTALLSLLFPASASAATSAFVQGILSFPSPYQANQAAVAAQTVALQSWTSGAEPAGREIADIRVPTLVADGAEDPLGPRPDDQHLAATIPGAQLVIYPGAAHGFLFQDQSTFVPRLEQFLG